METQTDYPRRCTGKRIVVLGGTSGMGFATAAMAAREGAAVVVASSRRESVDRAVARLPKGTEGHTIDLSNEEHVRDFFNSIGAFDHLVFTAGDMMQMSEVSKTNVEQARHFFDLRFWGAFMAAKYGRSQIRPGGSIVLTSGIAGRRPQKGLTVAAGISGAVEALTRALAVELAPIRVNAVLSWTRHNRDVGEHVGGRSCSNVWAYRTDTAGWTCGGAAGPSTCLPLSDARGI